LLSIIRKELVHAAVQRAYNLVNYELQEQQVANFCCKYPMIYDTCDKN